MGSGGAAHLLDQRYAAAPLTSQQACDCFLKRLALIPPLNPIALVDYGPTYKH